MVETPLLRDFPKDEVVVCYLENLEKFVGPEARVVAIHAHNPLGISYATDVYSKLAGKNLMPINAAEFLKIVTHPVIKKYAPKIGASRAFPELKRCRCLTSLWRP